MTTLKRAGLTPAEREELVRMLAGLHATLGGYRLRLPLKSPAYAALGVLQAQIAEIVGYVTGDFERFKGKPHAAQL